jgi:hypothetical protein
MRRYSSAMDSPPLPTARPWTPPETEGHGSPRSDYFSDPFRPLSSCASDMEHRWPLLPPRPGTPAKTSDRCDTPNEPHTTHRPKPVQTVTEPAPYTPTKTSSLLGHHAPGALRYPYTPESSRILRASVVGSLSPVPWDTDSNYSASPVQSALSSCIAHFENLTSTRELTEDQMEYIVGQFENMTSYLAAPDSQTKKSAEELFSCTNSPRAMSPGLEKQTAETNQDYVAEVGKYIEGVQIYTADLKKRFDEVKALNRIQLGVINDLRKKMNAVQQDMQKSLDQSHRKDRRASSPDQKHIDSSWESIENDPQSQEGIEDRDSTTTSAPKSTMKESGTQTEDCRRVVFARKPERVGFWTSFYEALDGFGDDLHER